MYKGVLISMQEPLMSAAPPQNAQNDTAMPNPVTAPKGLLYPRWPLMAVVLLNILGFTGYLLWRFVPCPPAFLQMPASPCSIASWNPLAQFFLLWLAFLILWLLSFILGYGIIEGEWGRGISPQVRFFLRAVSNFEPIRWLLFIYASLIAIITVSMLLFEKAEVLPLGLDSIVLFVTAWVFIRRPRKPAQQPTAQQQHEQDLANSVSPAYAFRSLPLIRGIWPPTPHRNNQTNTGPGNAVPNP